MTAAIVTVWLLSLGDSPGFGDSAGVEVDVANGLGIVHAIRECNSVKLLLAFEFPPRKGKTNF